MAPMLAGLDSFTRVFINVRDVCYWSFDTVGRDMSFVVLCASRRMINKRRQFFGRRYFKAESSLFLFESIRVS